MNEVDEKKSEEVVVAFQVVVEWISQSIEVLAVIVIVGAIITAAIPHRLLGIQPAVRSVDILNVYKHRVGSGLLLGLELMLAADVVDTIAVQATVESLSTLGLLALIRTFLSWSLDVEMEGCLPWRMKAEARDGADVSTSARMADE